MTNITHNYNEQIYLQLRSNFNKIRADVTLQTQQSVLFTQVFESYEQLLTPYLSTYQHHQGSLLAPTALRERFIAETAILHAVTHCLANLLKIKGRVTPNDWPVYFHTSYFAWYTASPQLQLSEVHEGNGVIINGELGIHLADFCDLLLSEFGARYLGEYYTPPALSQHIIELSCFNPEHLLIGAKLVDPACGSGNILSAVLIQILHYVRETGRIETLETIRQNLFGYDIQPFATTITQTILQYIVLVVLDEINWESITLPLFPNIKCLDSLAQYETFWNKGQEGFQFVIGNPPFMSVKKDSIPFIFAYNRIIKGHPNLYSMFLWWAVKASTQGAHISFLLPQSILVGPYFMAIREQLEQHTRIRAITRLINRTGVVGNADQQMMVLSLEVGATDEPTDRVALRVARNGDTLTNVEVALLPYHTVSHRINNQILWQVSDSLTDFEILAFLQRECQELYKLSEIFKIGTGNFVWNQHKDLTRSTGEGAIPLLSAASVLFYDFEFPYRGKHNTRTRQFAVMNPKVSGRTHHGQVLLIKRTTPTKVGRRLIAGIPPTSFFEQYTEYFIENHVNYIRPKNERDVSLLYGLLGWLNSDLLNFVFQLRNGSTQVSVFELELLPVNIDQLLILAPMVKRIIQTKEPSRQNQIIKEMNSYLFDWLELEIHHRQRIQIALKMKEK